MTEEKIEEAKGEEEKVEAVEEVVEEEAAVEETGGVKPFSGS